MLRLGIMLDGLGAYRRAGFAGIGTPNSRKI